MTEAAARLLEQVLLLSEEDQGEIADRLLEKTEPFDDPELAAYWEAEIRRRVEEIDSGKAEMIPWPEARCMIVEDAEGDDAAAYAEELRRRIEQMESGKVRPVPWPEVHCHLMEDIDRASSGSPSDTEASFVLLRRRR
jgi:hypothetical protein